MFARSRPSPGHVALISAVLLWTVGPPLARAQSVELELARLSEKALFIQGPNANVLAVESGEGLVLVDGGHASWYDELRGALEGHFQDAPIRALINTQWHPEQTGANVPLGREGVEIIAHENTMLWLSTEVWQRWSDTKYPPMDEAGRPTTTFWDDGVMRFGDETVHYGFMWNAHTDGDIWVYFEEENILATGGLVSNGRWPEIDWSTGGYIGGMLDGFVSLLTVPNEATVIIPADGPAMTLGELRAQNQMYLNVFDRLHGAVIRSYGIDDILAENLAAEYESEMGDSARFLTQAFASFQGRYRDAQNFRLLNIP